MLRQAKLTVTNQTGHNINIITAHVTVATLKDPLPTADIKVTETVLQQFDTA